MNTPIKLQLSQIEPIYNALSALDGYKTVIDGKDVIKPYEIDDKTRWNIVKNKRILNDILQTTRDAINAMIVEISGGRNAIDFNDKKQGEDFSKRVNELLAKSDEISGLLRLSKAGLGHEKKDRKADPIPMTVMEIIFPLIEEEAA